MTNEQKELQRQHITTIIDGYGGNKAVSEKCCIPVKTIESWKAGDRTPPEYVIRYINMCFAAKYTTMYPLFKGAKMQYRDIEHFAFQHTGDWWEGSMNTHGVIRITRDVTIKVQVVKQ